METTFPFLLRLPPHFTDSMFANTWLALKILAVLSSYEGSSTVTKQLQAYNES